MSATGRVGEGRAWLSSTGNAGVRDKASRRLQVTTWEQSRLMLGTTARRRVEAA